MTQAEYRKELEDLVLTVIHEGASDLHLVVGRHPTIRVSGELIPLVKKPLLEAENTLGLIKEFLDESNFKLFLETKEMDFSFSFGKEARFRGNSFYQKGTVAIALRLIPKKIKTLQELALPTILEAFTKRKQGFFLVVGPVGQGKSTTLAAMIEMINHERAENIITIEDPIEYVFSPDRSIISQREVRFDTSDFHVALRACFREDVDIILIGEMRGLDTISTAVTAAETGHMVFSTLHTNNASQTIDRIIDSFPPEQQDQIRVQLSGSLAGIFSQRLIPKISGGLVPAYELLINNNAVSNLIRERRTHEIPMVIETGSELGMIDNPSNAGHNGFAPSGAARFLQSVRNQVRLWHLHHFIVHHLDWHQIAGSKNDGHLALIRPPMFEVAEFRGRLTGLVNDRYRAHRIVLNDLARDDVNQCRTVFVAMRRHKAARLDGQPTGAQHQPLDAAPALWIDRHDHFGLEFRGVGDVFDFSWRL